MSTVDGDEDPAVREVAEEMTELERSFAGPSTDPALLAALSADLQNLNATELGEVHGLVKRLRRNATR
jgi:hypothetical protein